MVSDNLVKESNYATWANAMKLSLLSRQKITFISGRVVMKPKESTGKEYEAWEI